MCNCTVRALRWRGGAGANVNFGAYVDTDTTLTTPRRSETIELEFKVPESFQRGRPNKDPKSRQRGLPGRTFVGAVREVDTRGGYRPGHPRVAGRTTPTLILLPDGLFMAGSTDCRRRDHALLVPGAVVSENGRGYVHVVADGCRHPDYGYHRGNGSDAASRGANSGWCRAPRW